MSLSFISFFNHVHFFVLKLIFTAHIKRFRVVLYDLCAFSHTYHIQPLHARLPLYILDIVFPAFFVFFYIVPLLFCPIMSSPQGIFPCTHEICTQHRKHLLHNKWKRPQHLRSSQLFLFVFYIFYSAVRQFRPDPGYTKQRWALAGSDADPACTLFQYHRAVCVHISYAHSPCALK